MPEARQRCDDLLDDAVGEVFLLRIVAQILKWQYGNRGLIRQGRVERRAGGLRVRLRCGSPIVRHLGGEQKAAPRDRANKRLPLAGVADRTACRVDATVQRGVRYGAALPDAFDQFVLADNPVAVLHEIEQEIEDLRLDVDWPGRASKLPAPC